MRIKDKGQTKKRESDLVPFICTSLCCSWLVASTQAPDKTDRILVCV